MLGRSEPSWELEQSAPKEQLNNSGWFFDYMLDALTIDDLKELLAKQNDIIILPLYLYDHSGICISTGSFVGRAVHAEWDSGQVGYIYADHDDILNNFSQVTPETVKQAKECLEGEVEAYDAYLRGDCWGYRTFMYGQEMDSCWGFLGDIDDIKKDISSCLANGWNQLVDKLELRYQSAKEYIMPGMVIAGTFFICGLGEEDFTDLPDDLAEKYEQMFYHPQAFARVNENIIAIGADGSITHVEL